MTIEVWYDLIEEMIFLFRERDHEYFYTYGDTWWQSDVEPKNAVYLGEL